MAIIVDLVIVVLILGITYALVSEGLWGSALMFFNCLFSLCIALNFYEPLATLLSSNVPAVAGGADAACFALLFLITLVILRVITEQVAPTAVRFPSIVYNIGRIVFGLAGAVLVVGVLLLCFHMAPVHKKMFGSVDHDTKPPFGMGLDRRLLAFFQFTTGYSFARYGNSTVDREFADAHVFDRNGRWLIDHEDARPFGDGWRANAASEIPASSDDAPAGPSGSNSPRVPGGTAGAAVGMAPTN